MSNRGSGSRRDDRSGRRSGSKADVLGRAARLRGNATALETPDRSFTWTELHSRANRMARRLLSAGVRPDHRVASLLPLRAEAIVAVHGVPRTGAAHAVLDPRWGPREVGAALRALAPSVILVDGETEELAERALAAGDGGEDGTPPRPQGEARSPREGGTPFRRPRMLRVDGDSGKEELDGIEEGGDPLPGLEGEGEFAVLWTSGSSGHPRGVRISAGGLEASARASRLRLGLRTTDRWLTSLSPAHVGGLALLTRVPLVGSRLVLRRKFDPEEFLDLAREARITHASLVPVMLRRILDALGSGSAPAALRCLLIGGAEAPEDLVEGATGAGFPLALTYGLTEATSQVATAPPALSRQKPGHVGPPLPGVRVRIAEDGEIQVRGATLALGYLDRDLSLTPDGWLRTGDMGTLDGHGHLAVTGRADDRIVSGGVNVDPREVEAVVADEEGIREAGVVGLPDREWGERVGLALVPASGARIVPEDLARRLRGRLAPAKRPREIRVVSELPRTPNGKMDRSALRRLFDSETEGSR